MYKFCYENPPAGTSVGGRALAGALEWKVQVRHSGESFLRTVSTVRARPQAFEPGEKCVGDLIALDGRVRVSAAPRQRGLVGVRKVELKWSGLLPEHVTFASASCTDIEASFVQVLSETLVHEALIALAGGMAKALLASYNVGRKINQILGAAEDAQIGKLLTVRELLNLTEKQRQAANNCVKSAAMTEKSTTLRSLGGVYSGYVNDAAFLSTKGGFYRAKNGVEFHLRRRPAASFIRTRYSGPGYLPSDFAPLYLPEGFFQCDSGDIKFQRILPPVVLTPPWAITGAEAIDKACGLPQDRIAGRIPDGLVQCDSGEIRFRHFNEFRDELITPTRKGICDLPTLSQPEENRITIAPTPTPTLAPPPTPVPTLAAASPFASISAGAAHSCGIRADRTAVCWGDNYYGQADAPAGTFTAISAGPGHSCGIRADNTAVCWGVNYFGQADAPAGAFTAISAGGTHSCGIRAGNTIECWGDNRFGQADAPAGSFWVN